MSPTRSGHKSGNSKGFQPKANPSSKSPGRSRLHPPSEPQVIEENVRQTLQTATHLVQQQKVSEAIALCHSTLQSTPPGSPHAAPLHHFLGMVTLQQKQYGKALEHLEGAIALDAAVAEFHNLAGVACFKLGHVDRGIAYYEQAVALNPAALDIRYNLALGLQKSHRIDDAIPHFRALLQQEPQHIAAHCHLANCLHSQQQIKEAIAHYREAIRLGENPATAQFPINQLFPVRYESLWYNLGVALQEQDDLEAAEAAYQRAIALQPNYGEALNTLGTVLEQRDKTEEAIALYQKALELLPNYVPALSNLGNLYLRQKQYSEADRCFRRLLDESPNDLKAIDGLTKLALQTCCWKDLDTLTQHLWDMGKDAITTDIAIYNTLFLPYSPQQLQILAQNHATAIQRSLSATPSLSSAHPSRLQPAPPLKLGYLSGDYRDQAIAHLIYRLFELHDRQHFQVYAYSVGPNDHSEYRQKFETDADVFRDIRNWSAANIAQQIRDDGIHILIDLEGHTTDAQLKVYALRPAPLIMAYLGHPGTMGADYIDYTIVDPVSVLEEHKQYLTEQCLYLPNSLQINNNHRILPRATANRTDYGLPANSFVFCGFSKPHKYEPRGFALWMRILAQVPDSVLWLKQTHPDAEDNLRQFAAAHGVDGDRLIFAPPLPMEDHITRHQCADLFLDTINFSGHVTASDALWAGLPIITCPGETLVSRGAASLLHAAGLPELVVRSLDEYEALAIHLATHPEECRQYRQRLIQNRHTCPLFDTERTVRHLETAYQMAWDNYQAGQPPKTMKVVDQVAKEAPKEAESKKNKNVVQQVSDSKSSKKPAELSTIPHPLSSSSSFAADHHQKGIIALQHQRPDDALNELKAAIALSPETAEYHNHAGIACFKLGKVNEGIAYYQAAVNLCPTALDIRYNLALGLKKAHRIDDAVPHFQTLIQQEPQHIAAHSHLANCLQSQQQIKKAIAHYRDAIRLVENPSTAQTPINQLFPVRYESLWYNLGVALQEQGDLGAAETAYRRAIALQPNYGEALNALGTVLEQHHKFEEAIALYRQAQNLLPDYVPILSNLGNLHLRTKNWDSALQCFQHILALDANNLKAIDGFVKLSLQTCQWDRLEHYSQRLWELGKTQVSTDIAIYNTLFLSYSPEQLQVLAKNHATAIKQRFSPPLLSPQPPLNLQSSILKLGYVSGDYRNQAVGHLIMRLFELHDRQQFQVYAYSLGPNDQSDYRRKFETDADIFRDVQGWSPEAIARQIQADGIHILIDLEGYTEYAQVGIYALRPAPLIMSYLGHTGTMGADYIDYVMTDSVITPPDQTSYLTEQCIYLPSYQLNNDRQEVPTEKCVRSHVGLPKTGFVFCGFNKIQKIQPKIFASWMHILSQVPDSILWLLDANPTANHNLIEAAKTYGIEPDRLIFAPRISKAEHLNRLQCADLFLDTLYHNAQVTGSDALWAGVPMITCIGETFPSRVAASLLTAVGLPNLIVHNLNDYESLAVRLATHPEEPQTYHQHLIQNRLTCPLFNTEATVQHLEATYQRIWDNFLAGNPPQPVDIKGDPHTDNPSNDKPQVPSPQTSPPQSIPQPPKIQNPKSKIQNPKSNPSHVAADHHRRGMIALQKQCPDKALRHLKKAIALSPETGEYHNHAGVACFQLGQFDAGIKYYQAAVELCPTALDLCYNLALGLQKLERYGDAIPQFEHILQQEPHLIAARYQLGNCYQKLYQFQQAIAHYRQSITDLAKAQIANDPINRQFPVKPANLWHNLGVAHKEQHQFVEAEQAFRHTLALSPNHVDALIGVGHCFQRQKRWDEAIALLQQATTLRPDDLALHITLGKLHLQLRQWAAAERCFQQVFNRDPNQLKLIDGMLQLAMQTCQWDNLDPLIQRLWELGKDQITTDITLYNTLFLPYSPQQLQVLAQNYTTAIKQNLKHPSLPSASGPSLSAKAQPSILKLGYVSGDYRCQAMGQLMARLFELHDRHRFQVYAYSLGPDDQSDYRRKFEADADVFRDVQGWSSGAIAQQIQADGIHILIDLEGFTEYSQFDIYALRPAPLIVSYLGHTGTTGADYVDYVITDDIITPPGHDAYLTEQCIHIPAFQLNNNQQGIPTEKPGRSHVGLPEKGFVFCGFNKIHKIQPTIFSSWMRILSQIPDSVLWLLDANPTANQNLKAFAQKQGIEPERIIFAPLVSRTEHLNRLQCADLFLDTLYYNAQATGGDALWAGVPLITCIGETFPARVAASLLNAVGLPELVVETLEEYESLAIHLATQPDKLQAYRHHLVQNRHTCALFNAGETVRHLETAYQRIWDNLQAGNPPHAIQV